MESGERKRVSKEHGVHSFAAKKKGKKRTVETLFVPILAAAQGFCRICVVVVVAAAFSRQTKTFNCRCTSSARVCVGLLCAQMSRNAREFAVGRRGRGKIKNALRRRSPRRFNRESLSHFFPRVRFFFYRPVHSDICPRTGHARDIRVPRVDRRASK